MITPEDYTGDILLIGKITFSDSINEAEVTSKNKRFNTKGIGECKIEIYGPNEGSIPHFHLFNKNKSFETCICIYSNNYFSHGGKYLDKLNSKQCKELNEWMKKINDKSFGKLTNWETVVFMWEGANPGCRFPVHRKVREQPHYDDMINYKDA